MSTEPSVSGFQAKLCSSVLNQPICTILAQYSQCFISWMTSEKLVAFYLKHTQGSCYKQNWHIRCPPNLTAMQSSDSLFGLGWCTVSTLSSQPFSNWILNVTKQNAPAFRCYGIRMHYRCSRGSGAWLDMPQAGAAVDWFITHPTLGTPVQGPVMMQCVRYPEPSHHQEECWKEK